MGLSNLQLIFNAVIIVVLAISVLLMVRAGARYDFFYGVDRIQDPLKKLMIRIIVLVVFTSLIGAMFNIFYPLFFK